MSASWTNKFYKDEIKKIYKPKVDSKKDENWKEIKEEISLKKIKKSSVSLLKSWLKKILILASIISLLLLVVYLLSSWFIKASLN